MSHKRLSQPNFRCLWGWNCNQCPTVVLNRTFTTSVRRKDEALATNASTSRPPPPFPLDPNTVHTKNQEKTLLKIKHIHPVGSRRRRAAIQSNENIPFEQLPYQCFQEARKVLAADRAEKLVQITEMRTRIAKWEAIPAAEQGGEFAKVGRLQGLAKLLEKLKVLADVNDPVVKKRFEDGMGDMDRPIYRYLANKKWRQYNRPLMMQRIQQFHIVPDMLQHVDPTAAVSLAFGRRNVQPGEFVDSRVSEMPARLGIQVFDKGERLVTIAVVDPDVPDVEKDSFGSRCHFLAINVPVSPNNPSVPLSRLKVEEQVVQPWLPPFAQKGSPYHRLAIFVLQQNKAEPLDVEHFRKFQTKRDGWTVKQLMTNHRSLSPIGVNIFRTQWDEGTDVVMQRAGVEGADVQFVRKKSEKNVYKKKDGSRYR